MPQLRLFVFTLCIAFRVEAQPETPHLYLETQGTQVSLNWSSNTEDMGYKLLYAPYPYLGAQTIGSLDMGVATEFAIALPEGAAYYVAVQAYDNQQQQSDYSNIVYVQTDYRGAAYYDYWQTSLQEIEQGTFSQTDFLYAQIPDVSACHAGELTFAAQSRAHGILDQIRALHGLVAVEYDNASDNEVQQAALIQKANNFLSHTPPSTALCYSNEGYAGSSSSNISLSSKEEDPANVIIGFIDDAFNLSLVSGVGHRRALLNPFLQWTSYGQTLGAAAIKVFDFSQSTTAPAPQDIPDFIAFPYARYPYVFLSDKISSNKTPWNISLIEDKTSIWNNQQDYFSQARVSVREKSTGQLLGIQDLHSDTNGSGVPNNLSWTVDNWQYDTWYTVAIESIAYASGDIRVLSYDVFIDYKKLLDLNFPLEPGDVQTEGLMTGVLDDSEDKDSFIVPLAGKVTITGSSQFSNMGFYITLYDENKQVLIAIDETFSLDLPAGNYTLLASNCSQGSCYSSTKNYSIQIQTLP